MLANFNRYMEAVPSGEGGAPAGGGAPAPTPTPTPAPAPAPAPAPTPAPAAPADYNFKFPDGVEVDDAVVGELKAFATKHKLTAEAAQEAADQALKVTQTFAQKHVAAVEAMKGEWATQAKADKEFGGEQFEANLAYGAKFMEQFGTPELKDVLNKTGLGNHPEMLRMAIKVGKVLSQDSVAAALAGEAAREKTPAQKLYPNNPSVQQ